MSEAQIFGENLFSALNGSDYPKRFGGDAAWLYDRREMARRTFSNDGLPHPRSEAWRYTNLTPLTRTRFVTADPSTSSIARPVVEEVLGSACTGLDGAETLVFLNGHLFEGHESRDKSIKAGLNGSVSKVEDHLAKQVDASTGGFAALNTAFFEDGAFLYFTDNHKDDLFHIVHISAGDEPTLSLARNLIVLAPGAQATVIESYLSIGEQAHCCSAATEIVLEEGAALEHYRLQSIGSNAYHIGLVETNAQHDARYQGHHVAIGGKLARTDANVTLDGEGTACTLNGLYVVTGRQHSDFHTRIEHRYANSASEELFKGILDEHGRGVFNGVVEVRPDAQNTNSVQANHNLLLSENAEIDTKPELQIFADDVKCAHGATVGQLDDDMIFYLRSRGLDDDQARATLTYAFAEEVINKMAIPGVRQRVVASLNEALPQAADLIPTEILFED